MAPWSLWLVTGPSLKTWAKATNVKASEATNDRKMSHPPSQVPPKTRRHQRTETTSTTITVETTWMSLWRVKATTPVSNSKE